MLGIMNVGRRSLEGQSPIALGRTECSLSEVWI